MVGQVTVADHVDIGLDELAETSFLRTFATPHLLNLPTLEREREVTGMLDHIPAQRHGQIEVQTQPVIDWRVGFVPDLLQTGQQVNLLAGLAFFEQTGALFHRACLDADETVELENPTERVDDTLLHNTFRGEPLWKS